MPELLSTSPADTERVGVLLGERLRAGHIVLLTGVLGAGKTAFVRGLALGTGSTAGGASPSLQLVRI